MKKGEERIRKFGDGELRKEETSMGLKGRTVRVCVCVWRIVIQSIGLRHK